MRTPSPAARTMALKGLTDISGISRIVIFGLRGSYHGDSHGASIVDAITAPDDGYATSMRGAQTSAPCGVLRRAVFFFLSPVFRKLTPIWAPLTQARSQRR